MFATFEASTAVSTWSKVRTQPHNEEASSSQAEEKSALPTTPLLSLRERE